MNFRHESFCIASWSALAPSIVHPIEIPWPAPRESAKLRLGVESECSGAAQADQLRAGGIGIGDPQAAAPAAVTVWFERNADPAACSWRQTGSTVVGLIEVGGIAPRNADCDRREGGITD